MKRNSPAMKPHRSLREEGQILVLFALSLVAIIAIAFG